MMKFFRKKIRNRDQGTLTDHMAVYINSRQRRLADWLNRKIRNVPKKSVLHFLVAFCLMVGSYLIYIMFRAFN